METASTALIGQGKDRAVLSDVWPLYRLVIATSKLELHLPREDEIAEIAELAGRGVHPPGERPFLTPWTEGGPADRARAVLPDHWHRLAANHASQAVSRKLGYRPDGISVDPRGDEALISDRLRLTRERWATLPNSPVTVTGLADCRAFFDEGATK